MIRRGWAAHTKANLGTLTLLQLPIVVVLALLFATEIGNARPLAEWTLSIYIAADNDLDPFAVSDLNEMAAIGSSDQVNVVVQVDRLDRVAGPGVKRYRVEKGSPLGEAAPIQLPELNMGDPSTLVDFVEWSYNEFPAKRHAVIIWSHGSGWREANLAAIASDQERPATSKAIAFDDQSKDRLLQAEVESAFSKLHDNGVKVDLIGFDACLMSMVEVWYGLAPFATVGVGSQDLEPGYGWDYRRLLNELLPKPQIEPRELGALIVNTFADSIENSRSTIVRSDAYTAVDLSKIPSLSTALGALSRALMRSSDPDAVLQARARIKPFAFREADAWPNGVDLKALATELQASSSVSNVRSAANEVMQVLTSAIIANRHSENVKSLRPSGISIYFPETKTIWNKDPEGAAYRKENAVLPPRFVPPSCPLRSSW